LAAGQAAAPSPMGAGARVAHVCGTVVHSVIFSLGLVFLLHVANVGVALSAQGHWSVPGRALSSLRDGLVTLLRNLLLPFAEASFLDPLMPQSAGGIDVWGFWIPGLLSVFFITTASLGLATIRWRRPSRAVPYALLAAVLLVWQAQVAQALMEIATWEDLGPASGRPRLTEAQKIQQYIFKAAHESFTQFYSEQQCRAARGTGELPQLMTCAGSAMEAKLMPLVIQELCRPRSSSQTPDFDARVRKCKDRGQRMKLLASSSSDSDTFYCQCWSAMFDVLHTVSQWIVLIWLGLLAGVLSVLYIAAEPKLARMCAREQSEVMCFAVASIAILACKVTIFADGLPWAKGSGEDE